MDKKQISRREMQRLTNIRRHLPFSDAIARSTSNSGGVAWVLARC